jgi:hypothetical protein
LYLADGLLRQPISAISLLGRYVSRGSGGELQAEEIFRVVHCQLHADVIVFAAALISVTGITLGISICQR